MHVKRAGGSTQWVAAWLVGAWAWLVLCTLLPIFVLLAALSGSARRARRLAQVFARALLALNGMPTKAIGIERLPSGPHVLIANHCSFLDPILLIALLPARPGYVFTTRRQYRIQGLLWPLVHCV